MKSALLFWLAFAFTACLPVRPSLIIHQAKDQNNETTDKEKLNSKNKTTDLGAEKDGTEIAIANPDNSQPVPENPIIVSSNPDDQTTKPPVKSNSLQEPAIFLTKNSPNFRARNTTINRIILHNTQSTYSSAIATFMEPNKTSAHIVVNLDGNVTRLVPDSLSAQHAKADNPTSLGMEIVNRSQSFGGGLTEAQKPVVLKWVKYWQAKYGVSVGNITMHRMAPNNINDTDCAMYIWGSNAIFLKWRDANF